MSFYKFNKLSPFCCKPIKLTKLIKQKISGLVVDFDGPLLNYHNQLWHSNRDVTH